MPPISRSNMFLSIICIGFAALVAFVWIPLDVETGLIEKVRRRTVIGDALAPTVAAFFVGVGGVLLFVFERKDTSQPRLNSENVKFISIQIGILVVGFLIMLYAGPLAAYMVQDGGEYRLLRDSAPWKYIGYFLGGTFIVSGLISHVEGRFSGRNVVISICVVLALIVIYDLPFEDLLLPPNGDV